MADTTKLERTLLRLMANDLHEFNRVDGLIGQPEWVGNYYRQCILKAIREHHEFKPPKGRLTNELFEVWVQFNLSADIRAAILTEWTLIQKAELGSDAVACVTELERNFKSTSLINSISQIVCEHADNRSQPDIIIEKIEKAMQNQVMTKESKNLTDIAIIDKRWEEYVQRRDNPDANAGIKTGFKGIDENMGGLFKGELTLLAAVTGTGKSTWLKQLGYNIVMNAKLNVLHIGNEEHQLQMDTKYDSLISEVPYGGIKKGLLTPAEEEKWKQRIELFKNLQCHQMVGRLFVKEVPAFSTIKNVYRVLDELANMGITIDVVLIDHLPHIKPIDPTDDQYEAQKRASADCKELARSRFVAVVVPTQASTETDKKQAQHNAPGKMSVYGSKAQVHVANSYFVIMLEGKCAGYPAATPESEKDNLWTFYCEKNRDGPQFFCKMRHVVNTGKVLDSSNTGEVDPQANKRFTQWHNLTPPAATAAAVAPAATPVSNTQPIEEVPEYPLAKEPVGYKTIVRDPNALAKPEEDESDELEIAIPVDDEVAGPARYNPVDISDWTPETVATIPKPLNPVASALSKVKTHTVKETPF
jgi:replicative DNA helicase